MSIKMVAEKSFNLGSLRLAENQIFFISSPILAKRLQTKKLAHFCQEVSVKKKPGPSENKQIGPKENKGTGYVRNKISQAVPLFDDQFLTSDSSTFSETSLNIGDFEEKEEGLKEEEKEEEFEEFEEEEFEEEGEEEEEEEENTKEKQVAGDDDEEDYKSSVHIEYSCNKCGQKFPDLTIMRKHSCDKFYCVDCGKEFVNRRGFASHIKTHKYKRES